MAKTMLLGNCVSEPLSSYLKSLGVFRLLGEQADLQVRGHWQNDCLVITSSLSQQEVVDFFSNTYRPTLVIAPWNGASGFWDKTRAGQALQSIESSGSGRLSEYRDAISIARKIISELGLKKKPTKDDKTTLMRLCRSRFPDSALQWIDAVFILTEQNINYPPIFGTGGNDGKLDFSSNFMQNLMQVIDIEPTIEPRKKSRKKQAFDKDLSRARLELALFGEGSVELVASSVGQFDPGGVGGPNAIAGFEGDSLVNPWDFVLMIEGALMFAGSITWRLGSNRSNAAFPFMVETSTAGWGSLAESGALSRGEIWLPLWSRPATLREVKRFFAEGRAQVGRRPARTGVDFARAAAGLGVDRGVSSFRRYGFLQRSGRAHLAVPLGRVSVQSRTDVGLLEDLDPWLSSFRRAATEKEAPSTIVSALREIEEAVFSYCLRGTPSNLQRVLRALGRTERRLSKAPKQQELIRPLYGLSFRWIEACDDGSSEFRIALALAMMGEGANSIRSNLEPVDWKNGAWTWSFSTVGQLYSDNIVATLETVLERRIISHLQSRNQEQNETDSSSNRHLPIDSLYTVPMVDISRFLSGQVDDERIRDLLWGFGGLSGRASIKRNRFSVRTPRNREDPPTAYALLKLLFLPGPLFVPGEIEPITISLEPAIVRLLKKGDVDGAIKLGTRRLKSTGLISLASRNSRGERDIDFLVPQPIRRRLLASLLIPVSDTYRLLDICIKPSTRER
jgi:CRISPR-associated protein Csx17